MGKYSDDIEKFISNLSKEEILEINRKEVEISDKEHEEFQKYFKREKCSICKKSLKVFSSSEPCLHNLLRLSSKFKKKHFKNIYTKWGFFNISTYLRYVSNQESFIRNINDLESEKTANKKLEYTIVWKDREWTLSCANSDFKGHGGNSDFPHYHFQMRINKRPFIDFTDFHIPLSNYDLFIFDSIETEKVKHGYGGGGMGIQGALDTLEYFPDNGIHEMMTSESDEDAQFHLNTFVEGNMKGEDIAEIISESKNTGKTLTSLFQKKYGKDCVKTIVSPIETIPDIAKRKPGRGKKKKK